MVMLAQRPQVVRLEPQVGPVSHTLDMVDLVTGLPTDGADGVYAQMLGPDLLPVAIVATLAAVGAPGRFAWLPSRGALSSHFEI